MSSDVSYEINQPTHGLTIWSTSVFIVGEIAGSGVLALPKAVDSSGWIGLVLIVVCAIASAYTGAILGRAWLIVQSRNPQYQSHVVDPYPIIGEQAFGKFGRYLVSFSINFTLFGVSVVFLILAAENLQDLISHATKEVSFCYFIIILAVVLMPVVCLGTPKDFWPIAVGATLATGLACILLLARIIQDKDKHGTTVEHSKQEFTSFFTAFGTIVFAFGGHPAFPTFQADMRNKADFKWAVLLGYMIVLAMYLPTSTSAFFIYGNTVKDNILLTTTDGPITYIVQTLITLHLLFGFVIVINPFCQEIESKFGVPTEFTWKRCVARPVMVLCALFVAESIPRFGAILALVGGSTTTLLAYICPSVFYLKLCRKPRDDTAPFVRDEFIENEESLQKLDTDFIEVPLWEKILNYEIIFIGLIAGIASTASAIKDIASPSSFTVPCYVNPNKAA
ncbi:uncharacterized protein LOC127726532 [Mytilus californianus]|uniref:uncharacterized protein LOC127726532 n=1 Tax=Mytilus californianus TaxID=6549 RepID=UPI0022479728|nr:uncharacterized protein LOC127726532 [Mytilus californianus]XP_052089875.1 uncharacterized protein LOC127726532 [Mytilus californianus]XP_052089876.1 uncharacterized protein LOC127726532 [Mytilus californianus]XP_052089877.1 uncharacterized protein LOC127726532 [Mytilus californianus]XP_052089878.1 uncharacterized protein LOC127726532 [Mytilus californianus]XP_052089879.1 uncharacterized protein LOC127726532 [Mytilus californianus]